MSESTEHMENGVRGTRKIHRLSKSVFIEGPPPTLAEMMEHFGLDPETGQYIVQPTDTEILEAMREVGMAGGPPPSETRWKCPSCKYLSKTYQRKCPNCGARS